MQHRSKKQVVRCFISLCFMSVFLCTFMVSMNRNLPLTVGKHYLQSISSLYKILSPTLRDPDTRSTLRIHTHAFTDERKNNVQNCLSTQTSGLTLLMTAACVFTAEAKYLFSKEIKANSSVNECVYVCDEKHA